MKRKMIVSGQLIVPFPAFTSSVENFQTVIGNRYMSVKLTTLLVVSLMSLGSIMLGIVQLLSVLHTYVPCTFPDLCRNA